MRGEVTRTDRAAVCLCVNATGTDRTDVDRFNHLLPIVSFRQIEY